MRVLFSFVGGEGHLQPLLPLAHAAAAAGHVVAVTGAAAALAPVMKAAGLTFLACGPDVVPQWVPLLAVDLEREGQVVREGFADRMARARIADLLPLCAHWHPDVIVRDEMDFGANIVAESLGSCMRVSW